MKVSGLEDLDVDGKVMAGLRLQGHHDRIEELRPLVDLTILRASRAGIVVRMPVTTVSDTQRAAWRLKDGETADYVRINGIASCQSDFSCDECGLSLKKDQIVLGKTLSVTDWQTVTSSFAPTCLECYVDGRGGYKGAVLAAVIMES